MSVELYIAIPIAIVVGFAVLCVSVVTHRENKQDRRKK